MKVQNLAELRRHALATGAELEVDGRRFNAGQERVTAVPKPAPAPAPEAPPPAPEPAPPAPDTLTRSDVEEMLAQRDLAWAGQIQAITKAFSAALAAMPKPAGAPPTRPWQFDVQYDRSGAITKAIAKPI